MKDLGITKGEWIIRNDGSEVFVENEYGTGHRQVAYDWICDESEANMNMIADAGNTAQKCGLLPSELLEQRDELLSALKMLTKRTNKDLCKSSGYNSFIDKAEKAIKKANNE